MVNVSFFILYSLLRQLVELRNDLNEVLQRNVDEQRLRLQEAQLNSSKKDEKMLVDGVVTPVDSDLSDWLGDCADVDTVRKVIHIVKVWRWPGHV